MKRVDLEQLVGRTIAGKFVVEGLIGSGAMGAVFRARQVALEKTVAIKVLHGEHANDPAFAARFHREAKAASRLNHPNSMQVIDFGAEPDGLLYIAMEYLDGRSLHRLLHDEAPLPPSRIAEILMQTLAALAVAHDMGVVHRDLKPENIVVLRGTDDDGRPRDVVKVCDFGIAKITDPRAYRASGEQPSVAPVTTAGFLVGTPEYMSPEQGRGDKLDARSDLYSVGIILYEMLTGSVPFEAESAIGVVFKHIHDPPPRPSSVRPGIDARLEAVCLRALRKTPAERYASAREMRAELRPVAEYGPRSTDPGVRVQVLTESPSSVNAATVEMQTAPRMPGSDEVAIAKPTFAGTTSAVPGLPRRRRGLVVAGALLAWGLVGGAAITAVVHLRSGASGSAAADAAPGAAPSVTSAEAPPPQEDLLPPLEAPLPPAHGPAPSAAARASGTRPAGPPASGHATATTTATTTPTTTPTATTTATATATATATSTPPAAVLPDPTFDPERAYVEVGIINGQGVRDRAVRGALHGVGLAQCYRSALRAHGSRATGVASLNLSFDETGLARTAIATGADFLPGLTRCLQTVASGVRVDRSQVDSAGGVAEVILSFRAP
jgi:serine/threonine-protein kinase